MIYGPVDIQRFRVDFEAAWSPSGDAGSLPEMPWAINRPPREIINPARLRPVKPQAVLAIRGAGGG